MPILKIFSLVAYRVVALNIFLNKYSIWFCGPDNSLILSLYQIHIRQCTHVFSKGFCNLYTRIRNITWQYFLETPAKLRLSIS